MISIKKYNPKMKKNWDDFVNQSNTGTIFHKQSFLNYHLKRKFHDYSLLFYNKNVLVSVLPAALIKNKNHNPNNYFSGKTNLKIGPLTPIPIWGAYGIYIYIYMHIYI